MISEVFCTPVAFVQHPLTFTASVGIATQWHSPRSLDVKSNLVHKDAHTQTTQMLSSKSTLAEYVRSHYLRADSKTPLSSCTTYMRITNDSLSIALPKSWHAFIIFSVMMFRTRTHASQCTDCIPMVLWTNELNKVCQSFKE